MLAYVCDWCRIWKTEPKQFKNLPVHPYLVELVPVLVQFLQSLRTCNSGEHFLTIILSATQAINTKEEQRDSEGNPFIPEATEKELDLVTYLPTMHTIIVAGVPDWDTLKTSGTSFERRAMATWINKVIQELVLCLAAFDADAAYPDCNHPDYRLRLNNTYAGLHKMITDYLRRIRK